MSEVGTRYWFEFILFFEKTNKQAVNTKTSCSELRGACRAAPEAAQRRRCEAADAGERVLELVLALLGPLEGQLDRLHLLAGQLENGGDDGIQSTLFAQVAAAHKFVHAVLQIFHVNCRIRAFVQLFRALKKGQQLLHSILQSPLIETTKATCIRNACCMSIRE